MAAYTVSVHLSVFDPQAVFQAALRKSLDRQPELTDEEAAMWLKQDGEIDVGECLRMLIDPGISLPGTDINDSSVVLDFTD